MIINGVKVDNKLIVEYVDDYLKNKDIESLIEKTGYTKNQILYMLTRRKIDKSKVINEAYTNISGDKAIAISDTHFGSIYENKKYIDIVLNIACKENIPIIFNGGDLIQSFINEYSKDYNSVEEQTIHALECVPEITGIEHRITLGNHDFNAFLKDKIILDLLRTRKDFKTIDFKETYYKWKNFTMGVKHTCNPFKYDIPTIKPDIILQGHSHFFNVKDNIVVLPTLSDDIKQDTKPGFIILYNDSNEINIENFAIENNQVNKSNKVLTLRKQ